MFEMSFLEPYIYITLLITPMQRLHHCSLIMDYLISFDQHNMNLINNNKQWLCRHTRNAASKRGSSYRRSSAVTRATLVAHIEAWMKRTLSDVVLLKTTATVTSGSATVGDALSALSRILRGRELGRSTRCALLASSTSMSSRQST